MSTSPLERGRMYAAPPGSASRWAFEMLHAVLDQGWLHPIVVTVRLRDGTQFTRALEGVDTLLDDNGTAYFENLSDADDMHHVPCLQIGAIQVQGDQPIDHSDELGRG